jgi:predicted dinucleotide-binding enzyme
MNITLIGAGNVARALGRAFARANHVVSFGVRDTTDVRHSDLLGTPGVSVVPLPSAAIDAAVVVLATPHAQTADALASTTVPKGVIVIDATNPLKPDLSGLSVGQTDSAGEQVQRLVPQARVVKAFNTIGFNVMADPIFGGRRALMYIAGDDAAAKAVVLHLAHAIGFEALDLGDITQARLLEPFAMVWIRSAYALGLGREIAFGLLRR